MNPFECYLNTHPQTRYLDVFCADLAGVIRGKRYPVAAAGKVFESGMMLPGGCFLLAANGESMDPEGMGFSDGDPDEVGLPLPATLVPAPWAQLPTAQVMVSLHSLAGVPYYFEPRNVLRRVLERFGELNLRPVVAFELEFFLLAAGDHPAAPGAPEPLLAGRANDSPQVYSLQEIEHHSRLLDEIICACETQRIAAGAISAEYAPGQFEINLQHSDQLLQAADHCVMFKRAVQSIARKHGLQATFMPKPYPELSGSGLHLHLSLLDRQQRNAFDGGGVYPTPACGSELLYHAIGGLQHTMGDFMAVFAPSINSYRRFMPNRYVPVSRSWGFENRSVAIRIPAAAGSARRIEHRVAGADANPYLALAALLSGVHYGISRKIAADSPSRGNAGAHRDATLPFEAEPAFRACRDSATAAAYFGERYIRAYTSCKLNEYRAVVERGLPDTAWYL